MGAYGSEGLGLSLEVGQVLMMAFLLIAIAFLYSGIIVLISVFAKDTKEANSYIMPVYMLILIWGLRQCLRRRILKAGIMQYRCLIQRWRYREFLQEM